MARVFAFRRCEHLKKNGEIRELFRRGRCVSGMGAKLFVRVNGSGVNRVAFTFARKFGNAVERNRARRLGREAYRLLRGGLKTGFDLVLLAYPGRDGLAARMEQLEWLCSRAALFQSPSVGEGVPLRQMPPQAGRGELPGDQAARAGQDHPR